MISITYIIFLILSFLAAFTDFLFYRIPNSMVLALLGGVCIKLLLNYETTDFYLMGFIFLITLLSGYLLHVLKIMGAGDAKFLSASILWMNPPDMVPYLLMIGVSGGILALCYVLGYQKIDAVRLKIIAFLKLKPSLAKQTGFLTRYLNLPFMPARTQNWTKTVIPYAVPISLSSFIIIGTYFIHRGF